jgi:16S rRNA processing protein RimM
LSKDALTPDEPPNPDTAVAVGRITAAHGIRGEVKVEPLTDFPRRFQPGSHLWIDGAPYDVERGRPQGRNVILKLAGVADRNAAEALAGKTLLAAEATQIEEEDVYYLHDVIGLRVETRDGEVLGDLADVLSTGSNDVYVVRGDRGELLLPALDDVVLEVDVAGGRIVVDVPEGIDFTQASRPDTTRRRAGRAKNGGTGGRAP